MVRDYKGIVLSHFDDADSLSGIGLTEFLQVVHGVHVVHSLAIEVEPGTEYEFRSFGF